jgi:hypothetical protein
MWGNILDSKILCVAEKWETKQNAIQFQMHKSKINIPVNQG